MSLTTVTVTGSYKNPDGSNASGEVQFRLAAPILDSDGQVIVATSEKRVALADGTFSVSLYATEGEDLLPINNAYIVEELIAGAPRQAYEVIISEDEGTADLSSFHRVTARPTYSAPGPPGNDGADGLDGVDGADGASAYEVAVENGFVGDEPTWLASLVGEKGDKGDTGDQGGPGNDGANGLDGDSAYEVAVANGFVGNETAWLASLVGPPGSDGADGLDGADGGDGNDGEDGASAYEVAVANGFVGNEAEWLESLVGPEGEQGIQGPPGSGSVDSVNGDPGPDIMLTASDIPYEGSASLSAADVEAALDELDSEKSPIGHNHDAAYAAIDHDHDADYAAIGHNHDGDYDALGAAAAAQAAAIQRSNHTGSQAISTVTDLQSSLDAKQATSQKGSANGYAGLDSSGKVPQAQLPAVAITDTFTPADEPAMLALSAEVGDVAIRADISKTFILQAEPASTLGNWKEMLAPTDAVASVNGQTGVVVLDATDVGADPDGTAASEVSAHASDTTGVHGIADTSDLILEGDSRLTDARTPTSHTHTQVIPETHTYSVQGAISTSTVFPGFFVDESVGTLVLTKVRTKLGAGTCTLKIRNNGSDEVTGISVTTSAATNNFADESLADLDLLDIVCTADSGAEDLTVTLFFERTVVVS